ncbi:DUF6236 family protein [Bradyrhizobium algeriense]|uniref:DUF6236 family protein n=1 Tax=Bradyrhizobium algeriense TaxID=634784 RepID=UPI000D37A721|nr:DUF6236 family protein [Bradyrhizobium algeriense]
MGDAKRRKKTDPSYGRPVRGLVLTCPIEPLQNGFSIKSANLDPQDLRHALLFWDELVWPTNNLIAIGSGPEAEFLEEAGILTRPLYVFASAKNAEPLILSQLQAFKERDGAKNSTWDICQNSSILLSASADAVTDAGIQMELLNAIPVPDKDVPLNEILEFKRRRNDEFVALRGEIDNLVQCINSAGDPRAELERKITHLDMACADALKISAEWQFPVRLSSQKTTLDLKPFEIVAGGLAGYLGAAPLGLSSDVLAGVCGAAMAAKSILNIKADIGWRSLKPRATPFAYVARFNKELF